VRGVLVRDWTPFERLSLDELPTPRPAPRGLRLRVQAAGISFATSLVVEGRYQRKPPLPFVPGTEVAGVVVETGAEVARFRVGDRVCAVLDWGALAEEACALEVNTFALPAALDYARAIAFTNSYATSAAALTWPHLLAVKPGDRLLVHGAAGGVGLAAVEIGRLLGATVFATAGAADKLAVAREHGAHHTIDYRTQDFREAVLALTDGRGVDAVYDPVGGEVFRRSLRCMAPEARIMPVGFAGGEIPEIPANLLLVKNLTVCGLNLGTYYGWSPVDLRYEYEERMRALMGRLFEWFEAGLIRPVLARAYALDDFQAAMSEVLARRAIGRVAVVMDEEAARLGVGR
jgi:NADPH2:quinone reductase